MRRSTGTRKTSREEKNTAISLLVLYGEPRIVLMHRFCKTYNLSSLLQLIPHETDDGYTIAQVLQCIIQLDIMHGWG